MHKSEFNLLNALLHFQVFMEKVKERHAARGFRLPTYGNFEFLDQVWGFYFLPYSLLIERNLFLGMVVFEH